MSGRVGHRNRLICVNAANIREKHLYLTGHTDFFPADFYGASSMKGPTGKLLRLDVDGHKQSRMRLVVKRGKAAGIFGFHAAPQLHAGT